MSGASYGLLMFGTATLASASSAQIAGGVPIDIKDAPWQVALRMKSGDRFALCGGLRQDVQIRGVCPSFGPSRLDRPDVGESLRSEVRPGFFHILFLLEQRTLTGPLCKGCRRETGSAKTKNNKKIKNKLTRPAADPTELEGMSKLQIDPRATAWRVSSFRRCVRG